MNEGQDQRRLRAIDPDGDRLRQCRHIRCAVAEKFPVRYIPRVATSETKPRGEVGPCRKGLADGTCFRQGWECFESQHLLTIQSGQNFDSFAMECDKLFARAVVVAMVFRAVVQSGAIGAEGDSDQNPPAGEGRDGSAREGYGVQQRYVGALRSESAFDVAHARNLIAGGLDALCSGCDVGGVNGENLFRRVFKHVSRPKRTVDTRTEIFKL